MIGYAFFVIVVQKVIAQTPPLGCKTVPIFSLYQYQRQYSHCCLTNSKGNELIRPTTILPSISKSHILYLQQKETRKELQYNIDSIAESAKKGQKYTHVRIILPLITSTISVHRTYQAPSLYLRSLIHQTTYQPVDLNQFLLLEQARINLNREAFDKFCSHYLHYLLSRTHGWLN